MRSDLPSKVVPIEPLLFFLGCLPELERAHNACALYRAEIAQDAQAVAFHVKNCHWCTTNVLRLRAESKKFSN